GPNARRIWVGHAGDFGLDLFGKASFPDSTIASRCLNRRHCLLPGTTIFILTRAEVSISQTSGSSLILRLASVRAPSRRCPGDRPNSRRGSRQRLEAPVSLLLRRLSWFVKLVLRTGLRVSLAWLDRRHRHARVAGQRPVIERQSSGRGTGGPSLHL